MTGQTQRLCRRNWPTKRRVADGVNDRAKRPRRRAIAVGDFAPGLVGEALPGGAFGRATPGFIVETAASSYLVNRATRPPGPAAQPSPVALNETLL